MPTNGEEQEEHSIAVGTTKEALASAKVKATKFGDVLVGVCYLFWYEFAI